MSETNIVIDKVLDVVGENLSYAYFRWQDEKDYEDINEYAVMFKKPVEDLGCKFVGMRKRSFGFVFTVGDRKFMAYANSEYIGVKGLK